MDAKTLVINEDDLGFSADINATIEEAHRRGVVTNASVMVDGKEVDGALAVLSRNPKLGVGLHLDLCPAIGFYNVAYHDEYFLRESERVSSAVLWRGINEAGIQVRSYREVALAPS